jgi:hypothetical protein
MIDIYWDQINPKENEYDFSSVDRLIDGARRHGLKLILLWFATWKNGNMDYAPTWVKTNPQRFKRVKSPTGKDLWTLSAHCEANMEADKKAFSALSKHLKEKDGNEQTVIGLQVENEPGIIGSDRDYSSEAQAIYDSLVPANLIAAMEKAGKGKVYDLWHESGGKKSGSWPELFDWEAGEFMSAWSIATYIDNVAEAGKSIYNLPMYINVALMGQNWWPIPGEGYSSGGAVTKVLDIYKWFTPHIDIIAPDNYQENLKIFESICSSYGRDDNPLFIPESVLRGPHKLRAIADYNAIGYFGNIRPLLGKDGLVDPESYTQKDICQSVAAVIPLLLKYQGTGKIQSVIEEEGMTKQLFDFDGYWGLVQYGPLLHYHHSEKRDHIGSTRGWGLIIQASKKEFYLVGDNYQLFLRTKPSSDKIQAPLLNINWIDISLGNFISVDEGHFVENGEFVVERRRNGDQITWCGLWAEPNSGVVRAITCD